MTSRTSTGRFAGATTRHHPRSGIRGRNKVVDGLDVGRGPHQFRTRNDLSKMQRTRSKSNETAAKSTKLSFIPSLITVWLQVRVLPGPPADQSANPETHDFCGSRFDFGSADTSTEAP